MSKTYVLTAAYFEMLRKRFYYVVVPISLLALIVGFLIATMQQGINIGVIVIVPILLGVIIISLRKSLIQLQKSWASYRLSIEPDSMYRQQDNYETVKIYSNEITQIQAVSGGSIIVRDDKAKKQIVIPETLENFAEVKTILIQWHKIDVVENKQKQNIIMMYSTAVITLITMGIVMLGEKSNLVLAAAVIFLLLMIGSLFYIQRSSSFNKKSKRMFWWILLPIIMVGLRIYFLFALK